MFKVFAYIFSNKAPSFLSCPTLCLIINTLKNTSYWSCWRSCHCIPKITSSWYLITLMTCQSTHFYYFPLDLQRSSHQDSSNKSPKKVTLMGLLMNVWRKSHLGWTPWWITKERHIWQLFFNSSSSAFWLKLNDHCSPDSPDHQIFTLSEGARPLCPEWRLPQPGWPSNFTSRMSSENQRWSRSKPEPPNLYHKESHKEECKTSELMNT